MPTAVALFSVVALFSTFFSTDSVIVLLFNNLARFQPLDFEVVPRRPKVVSLVSPAWRNEGILVRNEPLFCSFR